VSKHQWNALYSAIPDVCRHLRDRQRAGSCYGRAYYCAPKLAVGLLVDLHHKLGGGQPGVGCFAAEGSGAADLRTVMTDSPLMLFTTTLLIARNQRILHAWTARQQENQHRAASGLPPKTRRRRRKTPTALAATRPP
jgi:hypothetical protein